MTLDPISIAIFIVFLTLFIYVFFFLIGIGGVSKNRKAQGIDQNKKGIK